MLLRADDVVRSESFNLDVATLLAGYPEIEKTVRALSDTLILNVPHRPIKVGKNLFAIKVDYPPLGSSGRGLFLVTYHHNGGVPQSGDVSRPGRVYTFLTITLAAALTTS